MSAECMLERVSEKLTSHFSTQIDLQTDFGDIPLISLAESNMEKAFHEIIKNAFEAVKSQGIISISTAYEAPDIKILISDLGQGIAPDTLEHIFKPYFSKGKANAQGLGLTYAKSVIIHNNGIIDISSTLKEGTMHTARTIKNTKSCMYTTRHYNMYTYYFLHFIIKKGKFSVISAISYKPASPNSAWIESLS